MGNHFMRFGTMLKLYYRPFFAQNNVFVHFWGLLEVWRVLNLLNQDFVFEYFGGKEEEGYFCSVIV